jgi:hypothetical protein
MAERMTRALMLAETPAIAGVERPCELERSIDVVVGCAEVDADGGS